MMAYRLLIDANLCTGCGSCEVACQLEHDLPPATRPIRALALGPFPTENGFVMTFAPATCAHCADPICVRVCPKGAMQQRADGIVFSDPALCIGCRTCAAACPFAAPVLNTATGKIAKCDYCRERVAASLQPACVLKCPTGALSFGAVGLLVRRRQQQDAERIVAAMPALSEVEGPALPHGGASRRRRRRAALADIGEGAK